MDEDTGIDLYQKRYLDYHKIRRHLSDEPPPNYDAHEQRVCLKIMKGRRSQRVIFRDTHDWRCFQRLDNDQPLHFTTRTKSCSRFINPSEATGLLPQDDRLSLGHVHGDDVRQGNGHFNGSKLGIVLKRAYPDLFRREQENGISVQFQHTVDLIRRNALVAGHLRGAHTELWHRPE